MTLENTTTANPSSHSSPVNGNANANPDPWEAVKKRIGQKAATLVENGMCIGLGTGSTAKHLIEALAVRQELENLQFSCIATSQKSELLARQLNLPLADLEKVDKLDLTLDGADEIDQQKRMIKGGGGALLREKIAAFASHEMVVLVDEHKVVDHLGKFPLPVEIIPFAYQTTLLALQKIAPLTLRQKEGQRYLTDQGNYIADLHLKELLKGQENEPEQLHLRLLQIPGVVETGIFCHLAGRVLIGRKDGSVDLW